MDKVAPIKTIRISARWRYVELWMSKCIKQLSRWKLKLYKVTLRPDATDATRQKYKDYRNMYN